MAVPAYRSDHVEEADEPEPHVDLLTAFEQLTVPLGCRAELLDGEIIVTPAEDGNHELSISRIIRQIARLGNLDLDVSGAKGIITPDARCIPDLTVGDPAAFADQESWSAPDHVHLVVEVTSGNTDRDRVVKRHRYAAAGIELYLLVDRQDRTVTLFSEPAVSDEDYEKIHSVPYGKPLALPEPFEFDLDTTQFP